MLLPVFDSAVMLGRLQRLSNEHQQAFGAACCERLLPNYAAFQRAAGWGDVNILRKALDLVWSALSNYLVYPKDVRNNISKCEKIAPSSADFEVLLVTAAQDACFATCSLLDFLLDGDVTRITQIAIYATDSIDLFVQEIENLNPRARDLEQKVLAHPLMQKELARQDEDLKFLENALVINEQIICQLRASSDYGGLGNLGV
jgi:uncharacterized protein YjaG (DUF416 family)